MAPPPRARNWEIIPSDVLLLSLIGSLLKNQNSKNCCFPGLSPQLPGGKTNIQDYYNKHQSIMHRILYIIPITLQFFAFPTLWLELLLHLERAQAPQTLWKIPAGTGSCATHLINPYFKEPLIILGAQRLPNTSCTSPNRECVQ